MNNWAKQWKLLGGVPKVRQVPLELVDWLSIIDWLISATTLSNFLSFSSRQDFTAGVEVNLHHILWLPSKNLAKNMK